MRVHAQAMVSVGTQARQANSRIVGGSGWFKLRLDSLPALRAAKLEPSLEVFPENGDPTRPPSVRGSPTRVGSK